MNTGNIKAKAQEAKSKNLLHNHVL